MVSLPLSARRLCTSLLILAFASAVFLSPSQAAPGARAPQAAATRPAGGWSSVIVRLDGPLAGPQRRGLGALGGYVYRRLPLIRVGRRAPAGPEPAPAGRPAVRRGTCRRTGRAPSRDEFTVGATGADVGVRAAGADRGGRRRRRPRQRRPGRPRDLGDRAGGTSRVIAERQLRARRGQRRRPLRARHPRRGHHRRQRRGLHRRRPSRRLLRHRARRSIVNVRVLERPGPGHGQRRRFRASQWVVANTSAATTSASSTSRSATRSAKATRPTRSARPSRPPGRRAWSSSAPRATTGALQRQPVSRAAGRQRRLRHGLRLASSRPATTPMSSRSARPKQDGGRADARSPPIPVAAPPAWTSS